MTAPDTETALIRPVAQVRHDFNCMRTASTNQRMRQGLLEPLAAWVVSLAPEDNPVETTAVAATISMAVSDYMDTLTPAELPSFRLLLPYLAQQIIECMVEFDAEQLAVMRELAKMLEGTWILPRPKPSTA